MSNFQFTLVIVSFIFFFGVVHADCTSEDIAKGDKKEALKYKIGAFVSILISGAIGVLIPTIASKLKLIKPQKLEKILLIIKSFAGGVILSTGFVHVLPDAIENLTSPCLEENPWGKFPFTGLIAMCSAIGTLILEGHATSSFIRTDTEVSLGSIVDEEQGSQQPSSILPQGQGQGHSHGPALLAEDVIIRHRHRVISKVLEVGIIIHSVIIGISLGASGNANTIKPLLAALSFHQFFEGMGLGECIFQAQFNYGATVTMMLGFSLTTPIGIAIGIGISSTYNENSSGALITEGILNSASSGILIYMALVDVLAAVFMSPKMSEKGRFRLGVYTAVLLGAGCMSLLAIWA